MDKKKNIVAFIVVAVSLACLWFALSERRQIFRMRKGVEFGLQYMAGGANPNSWEKYFRVRSKETLDFLRDRYRLKKPYVEFAYLGSYKNRPEKEGHLGCIITWLEIGFKSRGIKISYKQGDAIKTVDVPFPDNMWDSEGRRWARKAGQRRFELGGRIEEDGLVLENEHVGVL